MIVMLSTMTDAFADNDDDEDEDGEDEENSQIWKECRTHSHKP